MEAHKTNRILCCLIEKVKISKINRPKEHQRKLHSCGYNEIGSCMEKCFKKKAYRRGMSILSLSENGQAFLILTPQIESTIIET